MADYGLAAQIGRGGGGGAVAQVDPLNRMTQMMKLQNLQQNMMLAQEAEARAKGMFNLQKEQIGQSMNIQRAQDERARAMHVPGLDLARAQATAAQIAARKAEVDEQTANKVWEVYQTVDDPYNPEFLKSFRKVNPRAASKLEELKVARDNAVSAANKSRVEAQTAQFGMNKSLAGFLTAIMPTINDQATYARARGLLLENNPTLQVGAIPEEYTPENKKLFSGVLDRLRSMEIKVLSSGDIVGIDPIAGTMRYLTEEGTSQPVAMPTTRAEGPPATTVAEAPRAAAPPNAMAGPPVQPPTNAMVTSLTPGQRRAAEGEKAKTIAREQGERVVKAGEEADQIDYALGEIDKITKLIGESTGSGLGARVDAIARFFGIALPGAVAIAKLQPEADILLKRVPRFEGPQSKEDVASYQDAAGRVADPTITRAERIAAVQEIERLLMKRRDQIAASGAAKPRVPKPETGVQRIDPITVRAPDGTTARFKTSEQADIYEREAAKMHRQKDGR